MTHSKQVFIRHLNVLQFNMWLFVQCTHLHWCKLQGWDNDQFTQHSCFKQLCTFIFCVPIYQLSKRQKHRPLINNFSYVKIKQIHLWAIKVWSLVSASKNRFYQVHCHLLYLLTAWCPSFETDGSCSLCFFLQVGSSPFCFSGFTPVIPPTRLSPQATYAILIIVR